MLDSTGILLVSRRYRATIILALVLASGILLTGPACAPTTTGDNTNGNANNNGNDNGTPDPDSQRIRFTLTLRSLDGCRGLDPTAAFGCTGMDGYTFVDDVPHFRAGAPYNIAAIARRANSRSSDPAVFERDAMAGQVVTVIAFESAGTAGPFTIDDDREAFEETGRNRVEFLRFESNGIPLEESEEGVVSVTMNADMSIEAIYQRMPTYLVSIGGETDPVLPGFWAAITISAPTWLTFPEATGINPNNTIGSADIVVSGITYIVEMKTGTTVTFLPGDLPGFVFDYWDQAVSPCAARFCTLVSGTDELATAHWRPEP